MLSLKLSGAQSLFIFSENKVLKEHTKTEIRVEYLYVARHPLCLSHTHYVSNNLLNHRTMFDSLFPTN